MTADDRSDPLRVLLDVASEMPSGGDAEEGAASDELIEKVLRLETEHLHADFGERSTVVATLRQMIERAVQAE